MSGRYFKAKSLMASVHLVNLMKWPVRIKFKEEPGCEIIVPVSGQELTILRDSKTVGVAGLEGKISIVSESPMDAVGIPEEKRRDIRYVVSLAAFDALPDRKDFVTPAKPVNDGGEIRAYRFLRGHPKSEVTAFFEEADEEVARSKA